jgi:ribosomal-protein-alanine N-acetyltransferase
MSAVAAALHAEAGLHESWNEKAFAELIAMPGADGMLALDGEEPVGLVLWRVAADEAEILTICTAAGRRRTGIGGHMMETAMAAIAARGARRILLEVAVDNAPAIAFYGMAGFTRQGVRRGYYQGAAGPVDALILARES